ncbi:MAG TPA: hypothetical protein VKE98_13815, partial [Gemmataceae bacterium]|nr:hypothetical protein [Gemmataceae bacterium]
MDYHTPWLKRHPSGAGRAGSHELDRLIPPARLDSLVVTRFADNHPRRKEQIMFFGVDGSGRQRLC